MDATLKEVNLKKSIKKFFVDGLPSWELNFDKILTPDLMDTDKRQWMSALLEGGSLGTVSSVQMSLFLFSRKDIEGQDLAAFWDEVMTLLYPGTFDLYNTSIIPWVKIGGVVIDVLSHSNSDETPDGTKMKWVQTELRWTALW